VSGLGYLLLAVLVCVLLLPFVHAWAWCVADLLRDDAVDSSVRTQWLVALLFLSVVFIPAYVSVGPGRERWDPRMLWWPWKR
jgi:hypothetical protein